MVGCLVFELCCQIHVHDIMQDVLYSFEGGSRGWGTGGQDLHPEK